jgi:tetratricopeptide (TPR) repeat protein
MTFAKYVFSILVAIIFMPPAATGGEPQKVIIKGQLDPFTVVVKGVRDPSAWFRIESQHMIVYSNDDPDDVIELVNNLERLDYLLRLYLKPFIEEPEALAKPTIYFQGRVSWPPEIGKTPFSAVGMINSCVSATQMFMHGVGKSWKLDNASLLRAEDDYTLMHSLWLYTEHFLYRHTRIRGPEWFMTGFAAYFGGVRFTETQMAIGRDAGTAYNLLQTIDDGRAARRLSFDEVLHFKKRSSQIAYQSPEYYEAWEFMGRSFNLVHYMLSTEENRNKMVDYLDAVNNGDDAAAFADIFGLSGRNLDIAMWRYRQASLNILQVDMPNLPRANINFTRLSRIEGDFVLDNAVLKTCPTSADGRKLLARLEDTAMQVPAVDFAQMTLSRAQIDWGDPLAALDYLARAAQSDPYNTEAHYLLGQAYAKLAASTNLNKQDLLASARAGLTQAAALAPEAPEILYAQFRVELMESAPSQKGMDRATKAWLNGHDVPAFARMAALAYAWRGDTAAAYDAFNTLVRNERDPENAFWAATWLAKLQKGVPQDALLTAMRRENPTPSPFRSWSLDSR